MEIPSASQPVFTSEELLFVRKQFPILSETIHCKPLIYFDNGATSQKPKEVIEAIQNYYSKSNANIHRGVHSLSREITQKFEGVRTQVAKFLNANSQDEIVFTKGTTDSVNLVAHGLSKVYLKQGDEIIVSEMEHHSNILAWQNLREEIGIKLKIWPVTESGELHEEGFQLLTESTKLVALTHVSNTLGTINPVKEIIKKCKEKNIPVLIDGAQAVPHLSIDVKDLDCDFYCFSGHKMYAPTGIGVLYAKKKWIDQLPPYQQGGGIIKQVSFEKTEYVEGPMKFEAGTPNISGVIGLGAAIDYINRIGYSRITEYENQLLQHLNKHLSIIEGLKIFGESTKKAAVVSFEVKGIHNFDLGTLLDQQGIAVRTGHHCTQPLWQRFRVEGAVRVSLCFYNTIEEIDAFILALKKSIKMLS